MCFFLIGNQTYFPYTLIFLLFIIGNNFKKHKLMSYLVFVFYNGSVFENIITSSRYFLIIVNFFHNLVFFMFLCYSEHKKMKIIHILTINLVFEGQVTILNIVV